MKSSLACIIVLLFQACADVIFEHLTESQSLQLSCCPQQRRGSLTGLSLYHRTARSQTTLVSMAEGRELRVDPYNKGRLQLSGGLHGPQVNVTIAQLQLSDTGLYLWELSYSEDSEDHVTSSSQSVFLLVDRIGRSSHCSPNHRPLLFTIFTAAGLLLLALVWLVIEKCAKSRHHHHHHHHHHQVTPPPAPIYEEMARKQQQGTGIPQNNQEAPSHLEEADFPLYANPNVRQSQDNYYACPRLLALRA